LTRTGRPPIRAEVDLPGTEHLGSVVLQSNTKGIHPEWFDPFVASNLHKFTFEALIGLLEEREQCPSRHTIEGNPQLAAQAFGLKEI